MKLKLPGLFILLACASLQAQAVGSLADITIVDRDTGASLPVYSSRGEYWVAGRPGARYAVSVRNRLGGRVLAVASVDGVNVVSGETASWEQTGYVFSARQGYQITGWRKSDQEVAAFEFSDARESYAGRTGRPGQVGVIGVALFRELVPEPIVQAPVRPRLNSPREDMSALKDRSSMAESAAPSTQAAPSQGKSAPAESEQRSDNSAASATEKRASSPAAKLGTAHGQRETSVVSNTEFERQQSRPNEIVRIRYDSRENLLASGVIPQPMARQPAPNPFPESAGNLYVPDPPARRLPVY